MNNTELLALLKPEAAMVDNVMRDDLATIESPELFKVIHHAIFNGGKRIRPLLAVLASQLCDERDQSQKTGETGDIYKFAITFEYLHAASLLHDDVIDHADKRRGRTAANVIWGNTPVILAGDFLHARAMLLAGTAGTVECLKIISKATSAMVEAEFLQLQNVEQVDYSKKNYFRVLNGKTAALIEAACETGIIHAGGNDQERNALHSYGTNLGLAFQIVDDLLDYLGDSNKTGKATGNDFAEGKMTLPLIHALAYSDPDQKNVLMNLLKSDRKERARNVDTAKEIIQEKNGFQYARNTAEGLISTAISELDIFKESPAKNILISLAGYVLERNK
ncbi:MAG: polyprenyl synthetase family protein [Desulfobulbaceae bacterium]|nr:polyprenyl synthetase family protein [Desulfobulbaceae bacterium]